MSNNLVSIPRRVVLGTSLLGLGALAGCDLIDLTRPTGDTKDPEPTADQVLVGVALAAIHRAAATIEAAQERHPGLRPRLLPLTQAHTAQVQLFEPLSATPSTAATPSGSPTGSGATGDSRAATTPGRAPRALAEVLAQEETLTTLMEQSCLQATDRTLARLFGVCAAGQSSLVGPFADSAGGVNP